VSEPAPLALRVGVHMFNAGEYFEQHEVLEDLWRAEQGPIRELYQGILQIGVGCYHLQRGNHHGAITLLDRGLARLARVAPDAGGLDVGGLILQARRLRRRLDELGPGRIDRVEAADFPRIAFLSG
jgi:predicted metal-dependent hydrolase